VAQLQQLRHEVPREARHVGPHAGKAANACELPEAVARGSYGCEGQRSILQACCPSAPVRGCVCVGVWVWVCGCVCVWGGGWGGADA
jgi:hypothetical protein